MKRGEYGRLCDWGIPRTECHGVRLPIDFEGEVPPQMLMIDIQEEKIETAMATFDFTDTGYCFDTSPGRIIYLYFNPEQLFKYIRPVHK